MEMMRFCPQENESREWDFLKSIINEYRTHEMIRRSDIKKELDAARDEMREIYDQFYRKYHLDLRMRVKVVVLS